MQDRHIGDVRVTRIEEQMGPGFPAKDFVPEFEAETFAADSASTSVLLTITDTATPTQTFTTSWPINIPSTVGASTAFVGFTAGTGGATANQNVLTWTYTH